MNISAISAASTTTVGSNKRSSASTASAASPPSTVVTLSPQAQQAAAASSTNNSAKDWPPLLVPSPASIAKLAQYAGEMLGAKLDEAGIPRQPPFELVIEDMNSRHVTVKGERADAKDIEDLINSDKQMQMAVRNPYVMARDLPAWERIVKETLDFQREYAAAASGAELNAVLERWAHLLNGNQAMNRKAIPPAVVEMRFAADGLTTTMNGKVMSA